MSENQFVVTIGPDGQLSIPVEVFQRLGLQEGDGVQFSTLSDGQVSIEPAALFFVDTVSMHRMRYAVYARTADEAVAHVARCINGEISIDAIAEFSQTHVAENVIECRQVTRNEFLKTCDADNAYLSSWADAEKVARLSMLADENTMSRVTKSTENG